MNERTINRRSLIIAAAAAAVLPMPGRAAQAPLLDRAMRAMGGRALLARVEALSWRGTATVVAGDRSLELTIATRCEPFGAARTDSWPTSKGPAARRTLIINRDGNGTVERDGKRTALSADQARHEREQFGLYGYMLLAQAPTAAVNNRLHAIQGGLPPITLDVGPAGRLIGADYIVHAPDGGTPISERFTFDGVIVDKGLVWPRRLVIAQDGTPFFALAITAFSVELA